LNINGETQETDHFKRYFMEKSWVENLITNINEFRKEEYQGLTQITLFSSYIQSGSELIVTSLTPNSP